MDATPAFAVYVIDAGRQLHDATHDYEEAVTLCRRLVADDGYTAAEVWAGTELCYAASFDQGRVRVHEELGLDDLPRPTRSAAARRDRPDVPEHADPPAPPLGDLPLGEGLLLGDALAARPLILGDDPSQPVHWLGQ